MRSHTPSSHARRNLRTAERRARRRPAIIAAGLAFGIAVAAGATVTLPTAPGPGRILRGLHPRVVLRSACRRRAPATRPPPIRAKHLMPLKPRHRGRDDRHRHPGVRSRHRRTRDDRRHRRTRGRGRAPRGRTQAAAELVPAFIDDVTALSPRSRPMSMGCAAAWMRRSHSRPRRTRQQLRHSARPKRPLLPRCCRRRSRRRPPRPPSRQQRRQQRPRLRRSRHERR